MRNNDDITERYGKERERHMFSSSIRWKRPLWLAGALALIALAWLRVATQSDLPAARAESVATPDGAAVYEQHCLSCHAVDGSGAGRYPAIVGEAARKGPLQSKDKAYAFISSNMPQNAPGSLSEAEYKAVTGYVLRLNGVPTDYSDIAGHWAAKEIAALDDALYIDGYRSGGRLLFKPDQAITRGEFIRYFVKAKEWYITSSSATELTDVAASSDKPYILTAVEYGLIQGYPDHTFKPGNAITRAEIAAILSRSELLQAAKPPSFGDVPGSFWAAAEIAATQEAGLFGGYEDGSFRPQNEITRAEAVAVIYRLLHP